MTAIDQDRAHETATAVADRLAAPPPTPGPDGRWLAQSLAKGAAGIALLHVERARTGLSSWDRAHAWLSAAVRGELTAGPNAGLFFGTPAVAFAVHAAADRPKGADQPERYERALTTLDAAVTAVTRRRLDHAHARIDRGERPAPREFDLLSGLTGLGAYLLRCGDPHSDLTRDVLSYLVRLTRPLEHDSEQLPGWWTDLAPTGRTSPTYPGGHGNLGIAHGICGPLALLSLAMRCGIVVDGHADAVSRICAWLDEWRQDDHPTGPWWPKWVTPDEVHHQQTRQRGPLRPSWCYGTPGLAFAQQLAGLATNNIVRQRIAEDALVGCLADPDQLARITDGGLCHGFAGLLQTVGRAAADAATPALAAHLPRLADMLVDQHSPGEDSGLLEGDAGRALALHTAATGTAPASSWDACLLLT